MGIILGFVGAALVLFALFIALISGALMPERPGARKNLNASVVGLFFALFIAICGIVTLLAV